MFNLFRSREKAVRIMLGGILGVVAISMVTYLIPTNGLNSTTGDDTVLAEVGGQKLTAQQAQADFERLSQGRQIPAELKSVYFPQYLEAKIGAMAVAYEAQRMGLTVSDDEILTALKADNPQFFQNGVLVSKEQFEQFLASQGLTLQDAIEGERENQLVRKLQNAVLEGIVVTPKEVEEEFAKKNERAKIQYVLFPPEKFSDLIKPSQEELRKSFEADRASYMSPEKVAFQVVVLDQQKVEAALNLTDAQLRAAYSASMDNFRMPEKLHVRHILVKTQGKTDSEKKTLKAKADDLLKQIKNGADFAEVAKKNSDDTGSAEKGGDLDWIVRGQIPGAEFDAAAFALKPKDVSNVVTTDLGYEIIQLTEKQPARVKPFEEVKDGLAADLRKQTVAEKMQSSGDQIHDMIQKAPGSAAEIAKTLGAELITVPKASKGDAIPTLGNSPEIDNALAGMRPNEVSPVLLLPANRLAVVVLNSRTAPHPMDFSEVEDKVRTSYVLLQTQKLASDKAKEAADQWRKGEDIEKIAKSFKLGVTTTSYFGRSDAVDGLGQAVYVEAAFTKPEGTLMGPVEVPPGSHKQAIYKVLGKLQADPAALAAERATLTQTLKAKKAGQRAELLSDSVLSKLEREGKVKQHLDVKQRLIASYTRQ